MTSWFIAEYLHERIVWLLVSYVCCRVCCRSGSWTIVCTNPSQVSKCSYKLASVRPVSKAYLAAVVFCFSTRSHGRIPCKEHLTEAGVVLTRVYYKSITAAARFVMVMLSWLIKSNLAYVTNLKKKTCKWSWAHESEMNCFNVHEEWRLSLLSLWQKNEI